MSTAVLPNLIGLGFNVMREPQWNSQIQEAASGKRTGIGFWSYPRWNYSISYDILRSDAINLELQQLVGFFNARQGRFDPWLYDDPDDDTVTTQGIGTGDGTTTAFQLVRAYGGFAEPIFAPNNISHVYLNGVGQPSGWSVSNWGTTTPGILTFTSPPGNGVSITADFTFYFPCRFDDDKLTLEKFMYQMWQGKSVKFSTEK